MYPCKHDGFQQEQGAHGATSMTTLPPGCWHSALAVPWARTALVGDAAHTLTPTLGQGPSAGLETAALLDKARAIADRRFCR